MKYTFFQMVKLALDVIRTKFIFSKARIIRFPADIRGSKYMAVEVGLTTGVGCRLECYPIAAKTKVLFIGKNVQMNDYVHVTAMQEIVIGDNVLIASKVYISDCTHGTYSGTGLHSLPTSIPIEREYSTKAVNIGNNVWIGEMVSILPGVTIGSGSIIGANSVVTKDIPKDVIAVGTPAKVIKKFNHLTQQWEFTNN
jgi:acetyltransferase-like isoleucine patch superfamily enzyme